MLVNLVFNYLLIFGHFGFPVLGVAGAAIATVLSRFVEIGVIAFELSVTVTGSIFCTVCFPPSRFRLFCWAALQKRVRR